MPRFALAPLVLLAASSLSLVAQSTVTTLSASPTTGAVGTTVSLVATVRSTSSGTAIPRGSITFQDGQQALGSAPLSSANLVAPTLVPGSQIMGSVDTRAACLLAPGDLNADRKMDLLSYCGTAFQVFLGDGAGHYSQLPAQTYTASAPFFEPALLDVNGDGDIDIALPGAATLTVLYGNGTGTFAAPVSLTGVSAQTIGSHPDPIFNLPYVNVFTALASADLDGDGLADLVVGEVADTVPPGNSMSEVVTVFKNNGSGSFTRLGSVPVGTTTVPLMNRIVSFTLADLNKDGKPDVIAAHDYVQPGAYVGYTGPDEGPTGGNLSVLINQGAAALSVTADFAVPCGGMSGNCTPCDRAGSISRGSNNTSTICGPSITTGDFAGRGKLDMVVTVGQYSANQTGKNEFVYPGNGDGTFGTPHVFSSVAVSPVYAGRFPTGYPSVVATDLNGDGKLDLLDSLGFGYLGGGDYTFTPTANLLGYVPMVVSFNGNAVEQILEADFNGDGIPDFYFQSAPLDAKPLFFLGSNASAAVFSNKPSAGTHSLTAAYAGSGSFTSSTSSAITVTIGKQTPTVTGTATPTSVLVTQPVTLSVKVTGPSITPTGTITFTSGSTTLGTATLDVGGNASLTYTFTTVGAQSVTASYAGDANTASGSFIISVTMVSAPPGFTATPSSGNTTLTTSLGGSATSSIVVASQNGISGSAALSCTGLPSGVTCAFQPATVSFTPSASGNTTLTVSVGQTVSQTNGLPFRRNNGVFLAGILCTLAIAGARRRSLLMGSTLFLLAATLTTVGLAGCSGGSGGSAATAKSYNFNVVATSGTTQTTTAYTLNVQ